MTSNSANKIEFTDFDELFGSELNEKKLVEVPCERLHKFHNHPFKRLNDEKMSEMVDSIKDYGVLVPGIVRPKGEDYEIIAGHNRAIGCGLAGLTTMSVIIKDLTDDEAAIIMVDSNIQREDLLFSEKAFAYKIKFNALKHQGKNKNGDVTTAMIGKKSGDSGRTVQRYIRLTELHNDLLDLVDNKKIGFTSGVDLSYLRKNEQDWLYSFMIDKNVIPNSGQAKKLKDFSKKGLLTKELISNLLAKQDKVRNFTLSYNKIDNYFPKNYSKEDIEGIIINLLEEWKNKKSS